MTKKWAVLRDMIQGVDHAAAATDGKSMYVFGGRHTGKNSPSKGITLVQIYSPATDEWTHGA